MPVKCNNLCSDKSQKYDAYYCKHLFPSFFILFFYNCFQNNHPLVNSIDEMHPFVKQITELYVMKKNEAVYLKFRASDDDMDRLSCFDCYSFVVYKSNYQCNNYKKHDSCKEGRNHK